MNSSRRLLVVSSHTLLNKSQAGRLFDEGFRAIYQPDNAAALRYMGKHGLPHLLLIRAEHPNGEGLALCKQIQQRVDLPIILLVESDEPGQAAEALRYVDDYVRTPVEPDELVMRVRRVLSRVDNYSYASGRIVTLGEHLNVDYINQVVYVDGEERQLTPTENTLLYVLNKHMGNVVAAETLIERAWRTGVSIPDRNGLRVHIHRLRRKLQRSPDDPTPIHTERGVGYVFVTPDEAG